MRVRQGLAADLDKKLGDVAALKTMLGKTSAVPFCPPLPASLRLVRQFLFVCHRSSPAPPLDEAEAVRVSRLCACILLPHLKQVGGSLPCMCG